MTRTQRPNSKAKPGSRRGRDMTMCECPQGEAKKTLPQLLVMMTRKPLLRQNCRCVEKKTFGVGLGRAAVPKCQACVKELAHQIWSVVSRHSPARVIPGGREKDPQPEIRGELIIKWNAASAAW